MPLDISAQPAFDIVQIVGCQPQERSLIHVLGRDIQRFFLLGNRQAQAQFGFIKANTPIVVIGVIEQFSPDSTRQRRRGAML